MRNILIFLIAFTILAGCNNQNQTDNSGEEKDLIVSVEEFYANPENYLNKEVTVTGLVTHVCKHGGQKLFISGSSTDNALRIDVGKTISEFDIKMEGSEAEFTGLLELMDKELVGQSQAEHEEHHGDEEAENGYHVMKEKNYHLIAKSFKNL
jgi:hypothetical protein